MTNNIARAMPISIGTPDSVVSTLWVVRFLQRRVLPKVGLSWIPPLRVIARSV